MQEAASSTVRTLLPERTHHHPRLRRRQVYIPAYSFDMLLAAAVAEKREFLYVPIYIYMYRYRGARPSNIIQWTGNYIRI